MNNDRTNTAADAAAALAAEPGAPGIGMRRAFCALLEDEVDILARQLIELDALRRELADPSAQARVAAVGAALDALRSEKAKMAARLGCVSIAGP